MPIDIENWAEKPHRWSNELYLIIQNFLLKSLAYNTTHMTDSFINTFGINNATEAEALRDRIMQSIDMKIKFHDTAKKLEESLHNMENSTPWLGGEFYECVICKNSELEKKLNYMQNHKKNNSRLEVEVNKITKIRYFEVDTIYRHIRNALAHGCFRITRNNKVFIFDLNDKGSLSACGLISFDHLNNLYQMGCNIAEHRL